MRNSYSFFKLFSIAYYILRTKLISSNSRLIRFPIDLRGKSMIDFGSKLTTGKYCRIEAIRIDKKHCKKIIFGENVQINDFVHICALEKVEIGNNVLIASHVYISDNSHGKYKGGEGDSIPTVPPLERKYVITPVYIGDNTWIGEGVIIMPGVRIGKGCVIGAHSIVKTNILDYSIAVGSPARIIKRYSFESKCWKKTDVFGKFL